MVSDWAKLAEYFHKDEINVTCMFHSVSIVQLIDVFVEFCVNLLLFFIAKLSRRRKQRYTYIIIIIRKDFN